MFKITIQFLKVCMQFWGKYENADSAKVAKDAIALLSSVVAQTLKAPQTRTSSRAHSNNFLNSNTILSISYYLFAAETLLNIDACWLTPL